MLVLNNKCNFTKNEFIDYQKELQEIAATANVILCPTAINISNFNLTNISLGAQDVSKFSKGAHTGEISASQLASYNVKYCIVGHSERRTSFHETENDINLKIKNLLENNIIPIVCLGETLLEKQENLTSEKLTNAAKQLKNNLTKEEVNKLIIAYEPLWAIGSGLIPNITELEQNLSILKQNFPHNKILYGGSIDTNNIKIFQESTLLDGYLLGGLSLNPTSLKKILKILKNN